jgi:phospholipase/carboxylesterase
VNEAVVAQLSGPVIEPENGAPESMVILCHGYGSNGDDLIQLAPQWQAILPGTVFLSPNAPEACPGAPGGYQWFPLTSMDRDERKAGVYGAAPILNGFIDQSLEKYGLTEDRLALVGFSQGTMMSLHVGPRREKQLAGILGFSGALTAPENLVAEIRSKPPVSLFHGEQDNMIPFPAMFEAVGALEAAGMKVQRHLSPGVPHSIGPDGLQKGGAFLASIFG